MTEAPGDVTLRPLVPADLPLLVTLEVELFGAGAWSAAMLAEELAGPGRWYVGAEVATAGGPAVVGYAGLWFDGDDVQVMTIGVAQPHQGRRIGSALLAALLVRARELGAGAALLEVRGDNVPALELYASFGFERLALRKRYYQPENKDAWTMRLGLGPTATTDHGQAVGR